MRNAYEALPADKQGEWFETADALAHKVRHHLCAGDIVLVKGSKDIATSQVAVVIRLVMRPKAQRNGHETREE